MQFEKLIAPMSVDEFAQSVNANRSFVVRGDPNKFADLITLDDIERVLNNGCNTSVFPQIIDGGVRYDLLDSELPWAPKALKKSEFSRLLEDKRSFMMMNLSQINPKVSLLIDGVESAINSSCADLHLYVSSKAQATGYNAHRDRPQFKLYLQVIGSTRWCLYEAKSGLDNAVASIAKEEEEKYLTLKDEFDLNPGDMLFMPPATFHKVGNPYGPRVSFSIPFVVLNPEEKQPKKMDRSYIPFKSIFEKAQRQ
ncbi:JmjC domain-containing protein [Agaribacterium sp. ZY112]|uniref:JmjC domain-containing protein n=1 Tax=Agaribacterium sp. ZY112 TaxID=3233574 RepID=UPI0035253646